MGRVKPSHYYERQAAEAKRREDYFRTRPARDEGSSVTSRGETTPIFYRSLYLKNGSTHVLFSGNVLKSALTDAGGVAKVGLLAAAPANETALPMRRVLVPSKAHWYKGNASATTKKTKWNTSWTKYYTEKSHASCPIGSGDATPTGDEVINKFQAIFLDGTDANSTLLGEKNGRAYLTMERLTQAVTS